MSSGLYQRLVEEGLLVPHEEVGTDLAAVPGAYKVLRPQRIGFVSYPYEWCFSELKDAALATLRAQELAMAHGMCLRDASAYNVQFHDGRPILIDTLSFGPLDPGRPWAAYRQFCQHFLAPLALMTFRDPRLGRLAQLYPDGLPLDLAAATLPGRARLRPSFLVHVVLHARSQRRHADRRASAGRATDDRPRFGERAFRAVVASVRSAVERLTPPTTRSGWSRYYVDTPQYGPEGLARKLELVERFIDRVRPRTVWDLGANTGAFSRLASRRGIATVAFDLDHDCVEDVYRRVRTGAEGDLLPLVLDLAAPSPAVGWSNRERMTLEERGPADLVLALALIHHLAVGQNIPLEMIVDYLARIGRSAVIEFVPKEDPGVRELLRVREDIFDSYHRASFEAALRERFLIDHAEQIPGSVRVLYLVRRR